MASVLLTSDLQHRVLAWLYHNGPAYSSEVLAGLRQLGVNVGSVASPLAELHRAELLALDSACLWSVTGNARALIRLGVELQGWVAPIPPPPAQGGRP